MTINNISSTFSGINVEGEAQRINTQFERTKKCIAVAKLVVPAMAVLTHPVGCAGVAIRAAFKISENL